MAYVATGNPSPCGMPRITNPMVYMAMLLLMNIMNNPVNDMTIRAIIYGHNFPTFREEKIILVMKEDVKKSAERIVTSEYDAWNWSTANIPPKEIIRLVGNE